MNGRTGHRGKKPAWGHALEPFGPQSQWSVLLQRREILLNEIEHSMECLARLRRDLPVSGALTGPRHRHPQAIRSRWTPPEAALPAPLHDGLDRLFRAWLVRLESELNAVTRKLEVLANQHEADVQVTEQSMFALLRAAG